MTTRSWTPALLVAVVALAALLLAACGGDDEPEIEVGQEAPDFVLPSVSGGEVALADYEGRQPVLLFFHMAYG